jgi:hypothetical protein
VTAVLLDHEILSLLIEGETLLRPDEIWESPDEMEVLLLVEIKGREHEIIARMVLDDGPELPTSYVCETMSIDPGTELHDWLGAQIDAIWAAATAPRGSELAASGAP